MFNKNKPYENTPQGRMSPDPSSSELHIPPAPEPAMRPETTQPSSRSSTLSTLSAGVKYEGNISGSGELQVDGGLKGDIRVVQVSIGEGGSVEGAIHADVLYVRGRVSGTVVAKQVHLYASARVEGDITQEQISIEKGAWFQGRCTQAKREPVTQETAPTPARAPVTASPAPAAAPNRTPSESPTLSKPERLESKAG